ncbi:PREDICTED: heart- and neural crest derivatives-expressed protein 2-like [Priapulus caudatus]|uniref:Heart- and neural crest derivatives-expressed protein 2-like n=1 Tax=Priapulus caudatus TaxID=37621 RepID=A0ABM1ETE4_PRICU|nr:PREDICTED: heart- and neural crest derivatives-expressed protein 2-like [Priapulus caudatus]
MSLVGGYHHQGLHPNSAAQFYPYPGAYPRDPMPDPGYYQSWMLGADAQMDMCGYAGLQDPQQPQRDIYGNIVVSANGIGPPKVIKRRTTANKKERRRTVSINTAFSDLRECIPNVPSDTKLSKIKTLRLATSYIAYLTEVLSKDDPTLLAENFKADLVMKHTQEIKKRKEMDETNNEASSEEKRPKGRTGWPQQVWAMELKQ